jgi:hypothetical protein
VSQPASGRFAGLIDGTFGLLRQTWKTTLLYGGIAFLPAAALYGWTYGRLFAAMAGTWGDVVDAPFPFAAIAVPSLLILAAAALQGLALLFVRSCVTTQAAAAVRGGSIPVPAIAGRVVRHTGARLFGQRVLQGLVYAGIFLAAVIVMAIVMAVGGGLDEVSNTSWRVLGLFFLCYAASIAVWVWLWVRFSLTLESVVIDGSKAGKSFGLSASLVRGAWWRVFGYRLLFSIMLGFAASLIATPVVFFATIRAYARYLTEMVQGTADSGSLADMFRTMGSGLPVRLAVFLYLQSLLNAFFAPVFMTLLYFEMKRRKAAASRSAAEPSVENEPETPDSAPSAPTVPQAVQWPAPGGGS